MAGLHRLHVGGADHPVVAADLRPQRNGGGAHLHRRGPAAPGPGTVGGLGVGKPWENHMKWWFNIGKPKENHGKTMGKRWLNGT